MGTIGLSVEIDGALNAELEAEARRSNETAGEIAQNAIAGYLDGRRRKRAVVCQALTEAEDGVFISEGAVEDWMNGWGTPDARPRPEPDMFPDR
ncbi:hypothetical protein U0C82_00700 [Fulvimarina sp. 2208YS6-2-32]|uniref:CopG family transcriptional regulator n=1 Tax=Fulvimarina uroteuthidis TaxID=3098149 RepID=A0ABU5HXR3_9HYPH|nr:hypothetical protein [Fulvimarina sp. 2208YS6-2-32]MDY8107667.1 hypothetical protein [Fulvimarina sp. 2208YS6-2-32]